MIATRFTADQLVRSEEYCSTERSKLVANKTIEFCKLLQHVYPNIMFAVDGNFRNPTNAVDYRGRVEVYVGEACVGHTDVTYYSNGSYYRYEFHGQFVESGKTWRKDPIKLVEALQGQNAIRGKNPAELFREKAETARSEAAQSLAEYDQIAQRFVDLAHAEAVRLALGNPPSYQLSLLAKQVAEVRRIATDTQEALDKKLEALADTLEVDGYSLSVVKHFYGLRSLLGKE